MNISNFCQVHPHFNLGCLLAFAPFLLPISTALAPLKPSCPFFFLRVAYILLTRLGQVGKKTPCKRSSLFYFYVQSLLFRLIAALNGA